MDDDEFGERLRVLDRRQEAFVDRLEVLDRRDTMLLQRLERLRRRLEPTLDTGPPTRL